MTLIRKRKHGFATDFFLIVFLSEVEGSQRNSEK